MQSSPDCRLVAGPEVTSHCWLEAVTETEKFCPHIRSRKLHLLVSDMHIFDTPVSVCMVAV